MVWVEMQSNPTRRYKRFLKAVLLPLLGLLSLCLVLSGLCWLLVPRIANPYPLFPGDAPWSLTGDFAPADSSEFENNSVLFLGATGLRVYHSPTGNQVHNGKL